MGFPQFDLQTRPFDSGLFVLVGAVTCYLLTSLYTWYVLPSLTIIVFFDIVGNLLVILGAVLMFEQPTATGTAVALGGGLLWFFEIVLLWRSYHSSGTMFLLFIGTVCFLVCFGHMTMYAKNLSQTNVDTPAPYFLIASGILAGLAVMATMFRTHIRTTFLVRLFGDFLLAVAGYIWLTYCRTPGYSAPPAATPSREYV